MILQYVRNKKGAPKGVVLAISPEKIGWSLCCKKDRFDKQIGLKIAEGRAINGSKTPLPHDVLPVFYKVSNRAVSYFKNKVVPST